MGRRTGGGGSGDSPTELGARVETLAEAGDGDLDDPVMAPLKEGMSETARQPHRALHHLERPGDLDQRSGVLMDSTLSRGLAFEVALDHGSIAVGLPADELDPYPHPIWEGRGDHPAQDGTRAQRVTFETEFLSQGHQRSYWST